MDCVPFIRDFNHYFSIITLKNASNQSYLHGTLNTKTSLMTACLGIELVWFSRQFPVSGHYGHFQNISSMVFLLFQVWSISRIITVSNHYLTDSQSLLFGAWLLHIICIVHRTSMSKLLNGLIIMTGSLQTAEFRSSKHLDVLTVLCKHVHDPD